MIQATRPLSYIMLLLALLVLAGVAAFGPAAPPSQAAPAAEAAATGEIVLVARDIVDLKWDPANYPAPGLQFVRWELLRGPSAGSLAKIDSGQFQTTDHYRDSGLAAGATYHYRLDVVRCNAPCGPADEVVYSFFSDSATAGVFQGAVHYSLNLASGVYGIGFGGVGSSAAVSVVDGATLTAGAGVIIQPAAGVSSGGLNANGGRIEITGATLKQISISFGDYYDAASSGGGWVKECLMQEGSTNVSIQLYGTSQAAVNDNSGPFTVYADQMAGLTAKNNIMTGGIEVHNQATAVIEGNEITNGDLVISGYGTSAQPKASAQIRDNTINLEYENSGIRVYYGATATVEGNTISYLGPVTTQSSVVMDASDEGTTLTAERNLVHNGKIAAFWGPEINLADNVLLGDGSAITVGCVVCGGGVQATGAIERNTVQSGWGLEMWAGSQQLTIRHNCIRGNDPGLTVDATISSPLDVRYNWWGHTSGPNHPTNPGGSGDAIHGNKLIFDPWDAAGTYCRTTPPAPTRPDLQVTSVAMVQVVEGVNTLVEAKPLAVIANVTSDKPLDDVVGLSLAYAGETYTHFYILEDGNVDQGLALKSSSTELSFSDVQQHKIVFFPGEVPFGTSATAQVTIDPAGEVAESNEGNNVRSSTQPLVKTYWGSDPGDQSLRILFYYNKGLYRAEIKNAFAVARRGQSLVDVMPVAPIDYFADLGLDIDLDEHCPPKKPPDVYAKEKHRALKAANPAFQLFVQLPYDGWWYSSSCNDAVLPMEGGRLYWLPKNVPELVFTEKFNTKRMYRAIMHRFNAPVSNETTPVNGGWIVPERRIMDHTWAAQRLKNGKMLSLLGRINSYDAVWVHATGYDGFLERRQAPAANGGQAPAADGGQAPAATGLLLVSGTVTDAGQAALDPIFELPAGSPSAPSGGQYRIRLLDAGDQTLFTYNFDLSFSYETDAGTATADTAAFSFALPSYENTAKVVLEKNSAPLTTLTVSANGPTVQVTFPNGGENLSGSTTISWTAGDVDGDDLTYSVLYSADDGLTWETLAMDLTTSSLLWDTDQYAGSDNGGMIKVLASDGYQTGSDTSNGTFSLVNKAPAAGIIAPIDEALVTQGAPVVFQGAAYDLEQGWLEGAALSWSSNLAGNLGSGEVVTVSLSAGQHIIQLLATDGDGLTGTATITVTAGPETRPDLSLTAADLSYSDAAVARPGWLAAEVRNVVADVSAVASFYDGPPAGGRLIGQTGFFAPANSLTLVGVDWVPARAELHDIYVVISEADPAESSAANNQAMIPVPVAEAAQRLFLPTIRR